MPRVHTKYIFKKHKKNRNSNVLYAGALSECTSSTQVDVVAETYRRAYRQIRAFEDKVLHANVHNRVSDHLNSKINRLAAVSKRKWMIDGFPKVSGTSKKVAALYFDYV